LDSLSVLNTKGAGCGWKLWVLQVSLWTRKRLPQHPTILLEFIFLLSNNKLSNLQSFLERITNLPIFTIGSLRFAGETNRATLSIVISGPYTHRELPSTENDTFHRAISTRKLRQESLAGSVLGHPSVGVFDCETQPNHEKMRAKYTCIYITVPSQCQEKSTLVHSKREELCMFSCPSQRNFQSFA
jgi:hypothetical protein